LHGSGLDTERLCSIIGSMHNCSGFFVVDMHQASQEQACHEHALRIVLLHAIRLHAPPLRSAVHKAEPPDACTCGQPLSS
jgi:hypothetical protein